MPLSKSETHNNYRDNAFAPKEIRIRADDYYDDLFDVSELVSHKFRGMTKIDYLNWRSLWKSKYSELSDTIRGLKRHPAEIAVDSEEMASTQSDLKAYQKLANTLLNAREYAKNVRRLETEKTKNA